jgi:hypothetical protein
MTIIEFKNKILNYLDNHYENFYFYGDKPFLQFNQYLNYEKTNENFYLNINIIDETVCSGNNAIVHSSQFKKDYNDREKFCQLIVNLGSPCSQKIYFKKTPIIFTRTPNYIKSSKEDGKQATISSIGLFNSAKGLLHNFVIGESILKTMYVNLVSCDSLKYFNENITEMGKPPWEIDNLVEDHEYKNTYYSYLIPMNRFMLFFEDDNKNCFYADGIRYDAEWIKNQPSIFTYNYKKIDKKNETEQNITVLVKPDLNESVICSLVNFWIHRKTHNFNFMQSQKIIEEANLNENDFCIAYLGCEYKYDKKFGSSLINYVHETIPFNSKFYQSFNYEIFSRFIAQCDGCVNIWKDNRIKEIKKFCKDFYDNKEDRKSNISIKDDFEIECKKLIKQAEIRAINGDFDAEKELKIFKGKAKSILIDIYDLKNPFRRGKKLEILSNKTKCVSIHTQINFMS